MNDLPACWRRPPDRLALPEGETHVWALAAGAGGAGRAVLARYLREPPEHLRFSRGWNGKPAFPPGSGREWLRFSSTRTEGLALLVVARGSEVGVDAERIAPERATERIADAFFDPDEVAALRALPAAERARSCFVLWTG